MLIDGGLRLRVRAEHERMKIRKLIQRRAREGGSGVAGTVNAAVAANVNEPGRSHTSVSSKQRIVQRGGQTVVDEEQTAKEESE